MLNWVDWCHFYVGRETQGWGGHGVTFLSVYASRPAAGSDLANLSRRGPDLLKRRHEQVVERRSHLFHSQCRALYVVKDGVDFYTLQR